MKFDVNAIVEAVKQNGIYICEDFLAADDLAEMRKNFHDSLVSHSFDFGSPNLKGAKLHPVDLEKFSGFRKVFLSREFQQVAQTFLQSKHIEHCHDIYVVKDLIDSKSYAQDLHFDVIPQIKFYFYLNDVTRKNGAFEYVPGSQVWTKKLRKENNQQITFENREYSRDLPKDFGAPVSMEAKAGTLIIFDTDMFHKAGYVTEGERWVVRGHSRILKSPQKNFLERLKNLIKKVS